MFQFVYWLKAFAALSITNAHYANIWPFSSLAFGGHMGNCIFFFVSGFCLYNIKESFPKWYAKKIIRIYPALWIVAAVNIIFGFYKVDSILALIRCLVYPTWFHFIGSIMLLYIVFYVVRFLQKKFNIAIHWFMLITFLVFIVAYIFSFDKSYFHIEDINEQWVRFSFFESMLLGAGFREKYEKINNKISWYNIAALVLSLAGYFVGKKAFSNIESICSFQFLFPIILIIMTANFGLIAVKLEKNEFFTHINKKINKIAIFLSSLTLEIYLGQVIIISSFEELPFPLDFILVTTLIILYAWILHKCGDFIQKKSRKLLKL